MLKLLLSCLPLIALSSCVIVEVEDDFTYLPASSSKNPGFVPSHYIQQNHTSTPLPPFRLDVDKMPRSLVLLQYDPTYLNSDIGFRSFTLEYFYIAFADGTRVDCIDPTLPLSQRTFPISAVNTSLRKRTFGGVITKRMDFSVHMKGISTRDNGQHFPFAKIYKYRYDGKKSGIKTLFDEWAEV
ncbi:MAG: hypothetical protein ABJQ29_09170 [Luteolibacter sp.]